MNARCARRVLDRLDEAATVGRFIAFVATLVFLLIPYPTAAADPAPARFEPLPPPPVSAEAVFVYDVDAGVPLFARAADAPRAPASLTKIVTALVVVEHASLDETVTIQPEDIVDENQSRAQLVAGDTLSVRDLLVGLLVPSGNDAALALARHVGSGLGDEGDPVGRFVAEMNRLIAERGFENSRFSNPSGLDADDHYASARDLALLTAEAIENPVLAEILGTPSATLASATKPDGYQVNTTHDLVAEGSVLGGKTGTTEKAGGCLITVSQVGANRIVTVLLGSDLAYDEQGIAISPRYTETRELLAGLPERYEWVDPAAPEAVPGLPQELSVWDASLADTTNVPVPRDRLAELDYRLVLEPPATPGAPVGAVLFMLGPEVLTEQPLVQSGVAAQDPDAFAWFSSGPLAA